MGAPETHRAIAAAFCSLSGYDHLINQLLNQQILTGLMYLGLSTDIMMQAYVITCLCRLLTANTSKDYADTFSSPLQQVLDHEKGAHAVWNLLNSESMYVSWETVRLLTLLIQHERAPFVLADVQLFRRVLWLGLNSAPKPEEKKRRRKKKKKKKDDK